MRLKLLAVATALLGLAGWLDLLPALLGTAGGALVAGVLIRWRVDPILGAADRLARRFAFTDEVYYRELQELSRAVLVWGGRR